MKHTVEQLQTVQPRLEGELMAKPGVEGIGIGLNEDQTDLAFRVFCRDAAAAGKLPKTIDGIDVIADVTGEVSAY